MPKIGFILKILIKFVGAICNDCVTYRKCFRAVLMGNVEVFQCKRTETTLISCLDYGFGVLFAPEISHIYSSVGYCIVYSCKGLSTTSHLDKREIISTLFYIYNNYNVTSEMK